MHKLIFMVTVLASSSAFADEEPLGPKGQIVLRQNAFVNLGRQTVSFDDAADVSSQHYGVGGTVEVFVAPRLSVGAGFSVVLHDYTDAGSRQTHVALEPRVGYLVPLTRRVAFWPTAKLSYNRSEWSGDVGVNGNPWATLWVGLDAPFVFMPAGHFFIGIGPMVRRELAQWANGERTGEDLTQTSYGLTTTLGGYF